MKCNNCGLNLDGKFKFCPECGKVVRDIGAENLDFKDRNFFNASRMTDSFSTNEDLLIHKGKIYLRSAGEIFKSDSIGAPLKKICESPITYGAMYITNDKIYQRSDKGFIVVNTDGNNMAEYEVDYFKDCHQFLVLNNRIYSLSYTETKQGNHYIGKYTVVSNDLKGEDYKLIYKDSTASEVYLCYGYKDEILFKINKKYIIYNIKLDSWLDLDILFKENPDIIEDIEGVNLYDRCVYTRDHKGILQYNFESKVGVQLLTGDQQFDYKRVLDTIKNKDYIQLDNNSLVSQYYGDKLIFNGEYAIINSSNLNYGNHSALLKVNPDGSVDFLTRDGCRFGGYSRLYKNYVIFREESSLMGTVFLINLKTNEVFKLTDKENRADEKVFVKYNY